MKVLHLVSNLERGGAEKQLWLLVRETSPVVEHHVLAVTGEGPWAAPMRQAGAHVSCWFEQNLSASLIPRLAREIRERNPAIVHCWLPSMNLLGGVAAFAANRARVIASIRNVDDWKPAWRVWLDRAASLTWDLVVCNSQAGRECARKQGIPPDKLLWIPNGIEPRKPGDRDRERTRFGLAPRQPVLAAVSRLVPQKRVDRVLDIAASLRASLPTLQLLIAGDGPERGRLESEAARKLPGCVRFLGSLPDPHAVFTAADALVMTSEREGTSNSLLEALQAGCPVFATDVGDNRFLIGDAGFAGEPLAAAIRDAFENPGRLACLRERAIARAAEYTASRMGVRTVSAYQRALAPANVLIIEESSHA